MNKNKNVKSKTLKKYISMSPYVHNCRIFKLKTRWIIKEQISCKFFVNFVFQFFNIYVKRIHKTKEPMLKFHYNKRFLNSYL